MGKIVVIGSANTDLVVKTDRMPSPGETILGGSFMMSGGGKGANQAVAASRLGGEVTFVARVGNDLFGERALAGYRAERLDVRHVTRDATVPSGVALICVDGAAENSIVVAPGANERLSPEDVDRAEAEIAAADFVVLQLEIPLPAVMRAAEVAERHGVRVILNPAPAAAIPDELEETRWVYSRGPAGEVSLIRTDDGRWLFSEQTLDSLPGLLESVRDRDFVAGIEGAPGLTACRTLEALKVNECEVEATCPIRSPIDRVREHLWSVMEQTTLRSLVANPTLESTLS